MELTREQITEKQGESANDQIDGMIEQAEIRKAMAINPWRNQLPNERERMINAYDLEIDQWYARNGY